MAWSIEGRTVLITGGNSGIGKASAAALAKRGADVVITARRSEAGAATAGELSSASGRPVRAMVLDLTDDASIRAFATEFLQRTDDLGVLINNAGVVLGRRSRTAAGYDLAFQVNHLGPFLLSCLLHDRLIASAPARIVTVSSGAHFSAGGVDLEPQRGIYRAYRAYARSKLANVLFARELDRRLGGLGVRSFSLHPGVVATRIGRDGDTLFGGIALSLMSYRMLSPEQGAATTVYAATDPDLDDHGGAYLSGARVSTASALAMDDDLARRLWSVSESVVDCAVPHG